jgi:EAL domain-containing protein (putative c-di-GMP-specific phosphodiesterase class I)
MSIAGSTGLSQLRTISFSEVKIDRTFVADLPGNDRDRAIVRSVIDLAHSLDCLVTAVGVESQDVADWLRGAGCDHAQGYLWQRPCPWTEVARAFGAATAATAMATMAAPSEAPTPPATATEHAPAQTGHENRRAPR